MARLLPNKELEYFEHNFFYFTLYDPLKRLIHYKAATSYENKTLDGISFVRSFYTGLISQDIVSTTSHIIK